MPRLAISWTTKLMLLDGMQHVRVKLDVCANWGLCSVSSAQQLSQVSYDGLSSYFTALDLKPRWVITRLQKIRRMRGCSGWPSKAKHIQPLLGLVMLPWKLQIHGLSTPRALCLRTDQSVQDAWSLIADYLNWIFGCGRSTSSLSNFGRERINDCNLGVLGVELSSFI